MDDVIGGLFAHAVRARFAARPGSVVEAMTLGELLARWVPYAQVRRPLDIPMNEDYELLMMRLASGVDGLVTGDAAMQQRFRSEVASTNPDLTLLRRFATARLQFVREAVERVLGEEVELPPAPVIAEPEPEPIVEAPVPALVVEAPAAVVAPPGPAPVVVPAPPAPVIVAPVITETGTCRQCHGVLPDGRLVHFCPHCGVARWAAECARCHEPVEPAWRFCVSCGAPVPPR